MVKQTTTAPEFNVNYVQVVEMTDEERRACYNKMTKKALIDMLMERDRIAMIMAKQPQQYDLRDYTTCSASTISESDIHAGDNDMGNDSVVWDVQAPWGKGYYTSVSNMDFDK